MVDCEDKLRWSAGRTNLDMTQGAGMSTLHSQPGITCRKATDWRGESVETGFVTLI